MDAVRLNQIDILPLVGYELHKAGSYFIGPCPFCGGRDRFTVKGDRWHCRGCGDGKYHGAIDFIMRRDNVDFLEACRILESDSYIKTTTPPPTPKREPIALPDDETREKLFVNMDAASEELLSPSTEHGLMVHEYLLRRYIELDTMYAWHLGAAMVLDTVIKKRRPAVSIPWYHIEGKREIITGIKYRFVDDEPDGLRYVAAKGSKFVLYGLSDALPGHEILLIVEGEINALSLWQCKPAGVTVLSMGSEGGLDADLWQVLRRKYRKIFTWYDDAKKTRTWIGQGAKGIQSPVVDGLKLDANTLLQAGKLQEFIRRIIGVECNV